MLIDTAALEAAFMDCLFREEDIVDGKTPENAVLVDGVVRNFGFHPERLESHRSQVTEWLGALPDEFHKSKGGGWSFLNACMDRNGEQWGEHRNIEQLFALGQGLGLVKSPLPRDMWNALPGGMPYYVVDIPEHATA